MNIIQIKELHPEQEDEWDGLISKNNFVEFPQSFFWSKILQKVYGYKSLFLQINYNENPSAFFSLQEQFLYMRGKSLKYRVINGFNKLLFRRLVSSVGPVIELDDNSEKIMSSILAYLDTYSKKHHIGSICLSPFRYEPHYSKDPVLLSIFEQFGYTR